MNEFKKNIFRSSNEDYTPPTGCRRLISFDYKGVGNIVFRYKICGQSEYSQYNFSGLPNSGGIFYTYTIDPDVGDPDLCIEYGTFERVSGSIVNVNNFIYTNDSCTI